MNMKLETTDPLDPGVVECPYDYYRLIRENGGVYRVPERGFVLVGGYDLCMEVIRDTERFSSSSGVGVPQLPGGQHPEVGGVRTLLTADPPEHRKHRELVNKAFSLKRISSWEENLRAVTDNLIDGFIDRGTCELLYDFAVPLPLIVVCDAMGLPRERLRQFKEWSDGIAQLGGMVSKEELQAIVKRGAEFQVYLQEMIEDRRNNLGDDFISELLRAEFDGKRPLEMPELISIVQQFLVAGNETTTNTIASGMLLLCRQPDLFKELRADFGLIPNLVEEVLRFESPVQCHFRRATRDTTLAGVEIPAGTGVGLLYGCANRDDNEFADGDKFDLHRPNARKHLAFSQGIHFCPGAPLARMESVIAFEHLLTRLDDIELDEEASDLSHVPSFTHRGLRRLVLRFRRAQDGRPEGYRRYQVK